MAPRASERLEDFTSSEVAQGSGTENQLAEPCGGARGRLLDDPDVLGFLALASRGHVELYGLALLERLEASALDVRVVDEDVATLLTGDKAEALI